MNRQVAIRTTVKPGITPISGNVLQRACACGQHAASIGGECGECKRKRQGTVQRAATTTSSVSAVPPIVHQVLNSSGQPLDAETRSIMEPRFGHDFSGVRVHTDTSAQASARRVSALAYTLGKDIVFGVDQYRPDTAAGQRLIAHELIHVVQQNGMQQTASSLEISSPGDSLEQEADRLSQTVLENRTVPYVITSASSFGMPRLACAAYRVGALTIQIDYDDVIFVPAASYASEIETRFVSWTGSPASTIHMALMALNDTQRKWVFFGLDLLVDNTTPAHSALNRTQAVQRLVTQAPSAITRPMSGALQDYPNEVLRVSGWFEVALSAPLSPPTGATLTAIRELYNPPAGPSAPPGGVLDAARLNAEIPPALRALLDSIDPIWPVVGTQSFGTIQTIGDQIQTEARAFFAPYADTAVENVYDRGWIYSANMFSLNTLVPTHARRISYLLNRAEIVGRRSRVGGAIFDNSNYDSGRPADRAALLSIVTTMEADPVIRAQVDRLIQHTGRTSYPPGGPRVGIDTEFNLDAMTECEARWQTINTLAHELLHVMVHPSFPASAGSIDFGQIIREGFTEVLGDQLYERLRARAAAEPAFKAQMETGMPAGPCPAPAPAVTGYAQGGASAAAIRGRVGDDNFRAAYFLGALNLVGL